VEKPSTEVAQGFMDEGNYFWNSGIFAFRASVYLEELARHAPAMLAAVVDAVSAGGGDHSLFRLDPISYASCPANSIDYAIMEYTDRGAVISLDCAWSDVGTWDSVWDMAPKSADGNAIMGDVVVQDSRNCLVHATHRMVASVGLDDIIVIETADAILVMHKDHSQDVKLLVERFRSQNRSEMTQHREVRRPWGSYDSVDRGDRYQIKRITVKPGARLSSQMHHHRAEHWVIVSGTARIYNGDKQYLLTENQSTFIPLGEVHSLENPGKIPLDVIEIQSGAYLGEDDIVRFQDMYGRA
jgi:mannose-1-phosphate guanylyltransferase/mannose-1-phosphate guanylyltransferase/mannose-6-phosphate isomerase